MPSARKLHRLFGVLLLLPAFGWATTGLVFLTKPGYQEAYAIPQVRTYPLEATYAIAVQGTWREVRQLRTVLGTHVLVRGTQGWQQLDPLSLSVRPLPGAAEIAKLVADAIKEAPARYGSIVSVARNRVTTDTGVVVTLDWSTMSLQQRGTDTNLIDRLYKVHYLQWTGNQTADRILGATGIMLLFALTALGARLLLR